MSSETPEPNHESHPWKVEAWDLRRAPPGIVGRTLFRSEVEARMWAGQAENLRVLRSKPGDTEFHGICITPIHTDTERLDWAFAHSAANYDQDWKTGEHWILFWHENEHCLAIGRSFRECIDNALDGNYKRID